MELMRRERYVNRGFPLAGLGPASTQAILAGFEDISRHFGGILKLAVCLELQGQSSGPASVLRGLTAMLSL